MLKVAIIFFMVVLAVPDSPRILGLKIKVKRDDQLIVPGFGAEQIVLGSGFSEVGTLFKKDDYKIIKAVKNNNLLKHVFKTSIHSEIVFHKMYYFEKRRFVVLANRGRVVALVSMNVHRVTIDSVDLALGVEKFLKSYKKYKHKKFTKNNNSIYNWNELGIGIIDDKNDDIIDMYYIFPKVK